MKEQTYTQKGRVAQEYLEGLAKLRKEFGVDIKYNQVKRQEEGFWMPKREEFFIGTMEERGTPTELLMQDLAIALRRNDCDIERSQEIEANLRAGKYNFPGEEPRKKDIFGIKTKWVYFETLDKKETNYSK